MIVKPVAAPVTIPLAEPTVATTVLLLAHVPPPPSLKVIAAPTQTVAGPEIAEGSGFTVTTVVVVQPVPKV